MTRQASTPAIDLPGGTRLPMVGFGTWGLRGRPGYGALRAALASGYRHIDTATMYGNEADVGRALADSELDRSEVCLTTKLPAGQAGHERDTLAASLRALGAAQVDLWLVHWPPAQQQICPVWRAVLAVRDEGLARSVGVSNFSLAQIDGLIRATGETPAVNQIPWSPARHDPGLLAAHRQRGVAVQGYSPLKGTDLTDPVLTGIAAAHGVTPAQVVLRWHLAHGIAVIPKSSRPERIRANLDVFGFELSPGEVGRIDAMSR